MSDDPHNPKSNMSGMERGLRISEEMTRIRDSGYKRPSGSSSSRSSSSSSGSSSSADSEAAAAGIGLALAGIGIAIAVVSVGVFWGISKLNGAIAAHIRTRHPERTAIHVNVQAALTTTALLGTTALCSWGAYGIYEQAQADRIAHEAYMRTVYPSLSVVMDTSLGQNGSTVYYTALDPDWRKAEQTSMANCHDSHWDTATDECKVVTTTNAGLPNCFKAATLSHDLNKFPNIRLTGLFSQNGQRAGGLNPDCDADSSIYTYNTGNGGAKKSTIAASCTPMEMYFCNAEATTTDLTKEMAQLLASLPKTPKAPAPKATVPPNTYTVMSSDAFMMLDHNQDRGSMEVAFVIGGCLYLDPKTLHDAFTEVAAIDSDSGNSYRGFVKTADISNIIAHPNTKLTSCTATIRF